MPEETLFKSEQVMNSSEIAEYLRMIADKLEADDTIRLKSGSQNIEVHPTGRKEFEIKVERETSKSGEETSLELEIEWKEDETEEGLEIE